MYDYTMEEGENGPLFYFKNNENLTYKVELTEYPQEIEGFEIMYSLSAYCLDQKQSAKKDLVIGKTIYYILREFLENNKNAILMYVCDMDDKRAEFRQRKFSNWYMTYSDNTYTMRKFNVSISEELVYYSAMIFDPRHYDENMLVNLYEAELAKMQEHK